METPPVENTTTADTPRRMPWLPWLAAGVVAVLVLALLIYGLVGRSATKLEPGGLVPGFQITAFDGNPIDPDTQRGKVLVINFFASWCDPCRREAPAIEQVWREYQSRGVQFYGVAYKDAASKAQSFLDQYGVTYPSAADLKTDISRAYGVTGVPETFVIDRQGRLVHKFLGEITAAQLKQELDRLLGD